MYSKKQRIAAMICVILLVLLSIGLILAAIFDSGGRLFRALLFAEIAVPILAWIYIWMFGKLTNKETIADFDRGVEHTSDKDQTAGSVTVSKNPFLNGSKDKEE